MKMKAIVHIGTEKTGTSTIQECLHINRELLASYGVGFLKSPGVRNNRKLATYCMDYSNVDDHIIDLGLKSEKARSIWKSKFKAEFTREINSLSNNINTVIISSEHFHSRLLNKNEVANLHHLLSKYFNRINILVYLRRQDQVATSLYSTMCTSGWGKDDILPMNVKQNYSYYNYDILLDKWSDIFGKENIIPRIMEKDKLHKRSLISDFFISSGVYQDNWKLFIPENLNESISWVAQKALASFNKHFPSQFNTKPHPLVIKIRNMLVNRINSEFPGNGLLPLRNEAISFYKIFADSNSKLAKKWFDTDSVFSEDFSRYPEKLTPIMIDSRVLDIIFSVIEKEINNYYLLSRKDYNKILQSENRESGFEELNR